MTIIRGYCEKCDKWENVREFHIGKGGMVTLQFDCGNVVCYTFTEYGKK